MLNSWSKTPVKERANLMMKIADIVESRLQQFAEAESKDQGKPIWLAALVDIPRVVLNMRSFAMAIQTDVNRSVLNSVLIALHDNLVLK